MSAKTVFRNACAPGEVVMLHRVSDDTYDPWPGRDMVDTPARLEEFINCRAEAGWRALGSVGELFKPHGCPWYMLTFDDGFRDNLYEALPVLERLKIPATVFVTVGFIGRDATAYSEEIAYLIADRKDIWIDQARYPLKTACERDVALRQIYRKVDRGTPRSRQQAFQRFMDRNELGVSGSRLGMFLDWNELRRLASHPLVTIGAHSWTHPQMTRVMPWHLWSELYLARRRLESELNQRVVTLSYPHGGTNLLVRKAARLAGYRYAFTTRERGIPVGEDVDVMSIPRRRLRMDGYAESGSA